MIFEGIVGKGYVEIGNSKFIRLLWNKFRITYFEYKLFIKFNVLVQSNSLGIFRIGTDRLLRLELMNYLNKIGYTNREITDFLNVSNIKKIRTNDPYKPKDVWVGLKKYNKRLKRFNNNQILQIKEGLYVTPIRNLK
jgi:hypothetical protein